jgi:hypothetical protein
VRELARGAGPGAGRAGSALLLRAWLTAAAVAVAIALALVLPYRRDVRLAVAVACVPLGAGLAGSDVSSPSSRRSCRAGGRRGPTWPAAPPRSRPSRSSRCSDLGFCPSWGRPGSVRPCPLGVTVRAVRPLLPGAPRAATALWRAHCSARRCRSGLVLAVNEAYVRADAVIISLSRRTRSSVTTGSPGGWRSSPPRPGGAARGALPSARAVRRRGDARLREALQAAADVLVLAGVALAVGGALVAPEIVVALGRRGVSARRAAPPADPRSPLPRSASVAGCSGRR